MRIEGRTGLSSPIEGIIPVKRPTAIILAGGRSTRLGRDKASALLDGKPLLQHVIDRLQSVASEVVVVARRDQDLPALASALPLTIVVDAYEAIGPVGGLFTGLAAATTPFALTVGCDMPLLQPSLLEALHGLAPGFDAAVPSNKGQLQPLCAVYARTCLPALLERIEAGQLRLTDFVEAVQTRVMTPEEWSKFDAEGLSFENLNRDADFERASLLLGAQ